MKRFSHRLLIVVLSLAVSPEVAQPQGKSYRETRQMLAHLGDPVLDREKYAQAFRHGFDNVRELVQALDDDDPAVRLKAQVVLRYIADPVGLAALDTRLLQRGDLQATGPVPAPITELDYTLIESLYLSDKPNMWRVYETRIALVIDGSQRARGVLDRLQAKGLNPDEKSLIPARMAFDARGGVDRAVLRNAFFIPTADRRFVTTELLALSPSKHRALVSLYVNRGALAEEWWHVVVTKAGDSWRFTSITQVGIS